MNITDPRTDTVDITLYFVKSVSLLLTQTRVSVEKSRGSRFLQQVERKGSGDFEKPFSFKQSPVFQVCCAGHGFVGEGFFFFFKCLDETFGMNPVLSLCSLPKLPNLQGPALFVCRLMCAIWHIMSFLSHCLSH